MRRAVQVGISVCAIVAAMTACSPDREPLPTYGRFEGHSSSVFRTVAEPDLIPEGIAYDPQTGRIFLGSFRKSKIAYAAADGTFGDFIDEREYGFGAGVGMRVAADRRELWACSATAPHQQGYDPEVPPETGLFVFDVDSGDLIWKVVLPQTGPIGIFNDLVLTDDGGAFVSGFGMRTVVRIDGDAHTAETFVELPEGHRPNGLDLSEDGRFLFVASAGNIVVVDPESGDWYTLDKPDGENFEGIDGLYFYNESLVVLQSKRGFGDPGTRVARMFLTRDYDRVERVEVLDQDHPVYDQPTTGVLDGHSLYYVANSQFTKFDAEFVLAPRRELSDVVVLRLNIPH